MPVTREVEEDRPFFPRLVRRLRRLQRPVDRVRRLGCREDALASGKDERGREDVVLEVRLRADQAVANELRDQRRNTVVAKPARVDRINVEDGVETRERQADSASLPAAFFDVSGM